MCLIWKIIVPGVFITFYLSYFLARSLGAKLELAVEAQCDEGSAAAGSSETEPLLGRQPGIQKKTSNKKTIRNIVLGTIGGVALIVAVLLVINYTFKSKRHSIPLTL